MIKEVQLITNNSNNRFITNPRITKISLENLVKFRVANKPLKDEFISKIKKFNIKSFDFNNLSHPNCNWKEFSKVCFFMPSTIHLANQFIEKIKSQEETGIVISSDNVIEILSVASKKDLSIPVPEYLGYPSKQVKSQQSMYKEYFNHLVKIGQNTKIKPNETATQYLERIISISNSIRTEQEEKRINTIKSLLKYEESDFEDKAIKPLSLEERVEIIKQLQSWYNNIAPYMREYFKEISGASTDKELFEAWAKIHIEETKFRLKGDLEKKIIQQGEKYNSSRNQERNQLFINNPVITNDYKQEFEFEPVYHWVLDADIDDNLPFKNEDNIYFTKNTFCCSTNKHYAECDFRDNNLRNNIKIIIHPKSKISKATLLGFANEVVYPEGTKFKLLHKEFIEYIDKKTQVSCKRLEVHMQELD